MRSLALMWAFLVVAATTGAGQQQQALFNQARTLVQQNRHTEAVPLLESLARSNGHPMIRYLLGFSLVRLFRYADAEPWLREIAARNDAQAAWLHVLGKCLKDQGKNAEARTVLDQAIARCKKDGLLPKLHFARALCDLDSGDLAAAEKHLGLLLELTPQDALGLYHLGRLLAEQGRAKAAVALLRRSVKADDGNVEAWYELGMAERKVGDATAAEKALRRVVAKVPGHAGAVHGLGLLLIRNGRAKEGRRVLAGFRALSAKKDRIDFLRHSVSRSPRKRPLRVDLARELLEIGSIKEALEELEGARALDADSEVYRLMARGFTLQGRADDAAKAQAAADRLAAVGR